ncbi:MAG: ABC transporter substrate-binding protein [Firmicutes bacterium]|nr:ABC transporter substrate-binding protein [Bacillota bacterium]
MKKLITSLLILSLITLAVGCSSAAKTKTETAATAKKKLTAIRVGILPTEDALPISVAEQKGLFKDKGLDVKVTVFKSAQERDAALQAKQIDGFMGDLVAAAALYQAGTKISVVDVLLGSKPSEGRFGILSAPKSSIRTVADLKGVPIATSSNTITEYVIDQLLAENGFSDSDIKKIEIKAIQVRLEALTNGQAQAAALPDPLLSFAEQQGNHLIIDDSKGRNLSQTILLFRKDYLDKNKEAIKNMLAAINEGVELINKDPNAYRELLVETAKLPKPIEDSYKINTYPKVQVPTKADVDSVLNWMVKKNIIKPGLKYNDLVNQEVQPASVGS